MATAQRAHNWDNLDRPSICIDCGLKFSQSRFDSDTLPQCRKTPKPIRLMTGRVRRDRRLVCAWRIEDATVGSHADSLSLVQAFLKRAPVRVRLQKRTGEVYVVKVVTDQGYELRGAGPLRKVR